jgi:hypothetical protein
MPLAIPIITDKRFRILSACGWLEEKDEQTRVLIDKLRAKRQIAKYGEGPSEGLVRAFFSLGPEKDGRHIHIDVATKGHFSKVPEVNSSLEEITESVRPFFGKKARIFLTGRYVLPWEDLPANGIIRASQTTASISGLNLSQTSAKFDLKGAGSIRELNWTLLENEKDVAVDVGLLVNEPISEDYLFRLYPFVEDAWKRLAIGSDPGGLK